MKTISILGSTGSIGRQTLDIIRNNPQDYKILGLAGGNNLELLQKQVEEFSPTYVYSPKITTARWNGANVIDMEEMASFPQDKVIISTVGSIGLLSTMSAIHSGVNVAIANKEVLVMAGQIVMSKAKENNVQIIPIDSEHNAIWQCLIGDAVDGTKAKTEMLRRIIITASGGAFRDLQQEELAYVCAKQALIHPTWAMGEKITIDCATLMNKGFEVIEANWLFGVEYSKINVVLHRESIIHGMVEFQDGSYKALLSYPDMHLPIQHALNYPNRPKSTWRTLDIENITKLSLSKLDASRYPCFNLALSAGRMGGTLPTVLSASDEAAVALFIEGKISYLQIPKIIEGAMYKHTINYNPTIDEIITLDQEIKNKIRRDY